MQVGEVRAAEDADFERLRSLCTFHDGWRMAYRKHSVTVWVKANDVSEFNMVKVIGELSDVSAATVFDVLNDPAYRRKWDFSMHEGFDICQISSNSDIGYYALKAPGPLKNRDFVTQRVWLDSGSEMMIFNHSVNHTAVPPKKHFIRAISYLTGYYVLSTAENKDEPGCQVTYITQSDPRGKLPAWVSNKMSHWMAPKVMMKLQKACRNYNTWKAKHSPELKPWLHPEQNSLPPFNPADIGQWDLTPSPTLDEHDTIEAVALADGADEDDSEQLGVAQQATTDTVRGAIVQLTAEVAVPMSAAEPAPSEPTVVAGAY